MSGTALDLLLPEGLAASVVSVDPGASPERLDAVVREVASAGAGVVLTPRRHRSTLRARLGVIPGTEAVPYLVLPSASAPAFAVPPVAGPLRYVVAQTRPTWPKWWIRHTGAVLRRLAPSVAVVVRPSGFGLFGWLSEHAPLPVHHVVLRPSWRGGDASVVVLGFGAEGDRPVVVAKVARGERSAEAVRREAEALAALRLAATAAGAEVPRGLALGERDGLPALVTTAVRGVSAAALVASGRATVPDVLARLRAWLGRWHRATCETVSLDADRLGAWVERPLVRLGADLPSGYADRVRALAEAVRDTEAPLVAAHHDLTMRNVLLDGPSRLGVVDWEEAEPCALPLTDWHYAAAELIATAEGVSRPEAVDAALTGRRAEAVRAGSQALAEAVGLSPEAAALAPHVGALRHAVHEAERPDAGPSRPFLAVVRRLAASPDVR